MWGPRDSRNARKGEIRLISQVVKFILPSILLWAAISPQDKKRQASPNLQDMMLEAADG